MKADLKRGEIVSLAALGVFACGIAGVLFVAPNMQPQAQAQAQVQGEAALSAGSDAAVGVAASGTVDEAASSSSGADGSASADGWPTVWDEATGTRRPMTAEEKAANDAASERERASLAEYEEQLTPYKQTVPLGQTFSLANIDDGTLTITNPYTGEKIQTGVNKFVMWTGTLDVTFLDATLYDSLEAAQAEVELGTVLDADASEGMDDPRLLVVHVKVSNVDATPGLEGVWYELFSISEFQPVYPSDPSDSSGWFSIASLATFDGAPEGAGEHDFDNNDFALAQGETRVLTMGCWVDGSVDPEKIVVRPSLSGSNPGPITFDLGLGAAE